MSEQIAEQDRALLRDSQILVIEDNVLNHTSLLRLLAYAGVPTNQCVCLYSGQAALQLAAARQRRFDVVLLDLVLPTYDGYQVLEQLRADPQLRMALVVAVTGFNAIEELRHARAAGFDGFLGKPLLPERFPDQMVRILRGEPVWEAR